MLALVGYETRACYDGWTALIEAEYFGPNICLIDLNMPGMDGDDLAVRLRKWAAGRPLRLVAVTAMNSETDRRRIQAAGFDRHLVKPAEPIDLLAAIDEPY